MSNAELIQHTKELLATMSVDEVVERLIVDGYFADTDGIRKYLRPIVRELSFHVDMAKEKQ